MTSIYQMSAGWALVAAAAREGDLPEPYTATIGEHSIGLQLASVADLAQWAQWAEATIAEAEPHQYLDQWAVHHRAEGTIYDLPVDLVAVVFGHMADEQRYDCGRCGAAFGVSPGFVPNGTVDDDRFEVEVGRHQAGECTRTVVSL